MSETLSVVVDGESGVPPYEQVRDGIRDRVDDGSLAPGFRLPPVRSLAASLGLAPNTVARAYKELEAAGIVETRGRAGTFVAGRGVDRAVRSAAASYVAEARGLGLPDDDALAAVRRALGKSDGTGSR
ncbi:MAG: Transcriptional regulator, GntR family [uncultured Nocardioides sp.]|uniref:Transcriptional regulator, GntR family n=1 Tax=uncultured Nocardioides sp. TaxID=198441 RepID=A0A6J4MTM0_9ACTN|nr:MAG: Transcriptional regulator, GntR family [uncultured Nocardioides sp.]